MIQSILRLVLLVGFGSVLLAPASAQDATPAQKSDLRSHCTRDFLEHCRGVPANGVPAFQCLEKNLDKLSDGCKQAVLSVDPTGKAEVGNN